jgi:predicted transcriptional regulator
MNSHDERSVLLTAAELPHTASQSTSSTDELIAGLPVRVRNIALLRGLGYSFREIGKQLGVTAQAVSIMLLRYRRSLKSLKGSVELADLSARAANALGRRKITTREEARRADVLRLLQNERNCGRKTLEEIERWLGQ